MGLHRHGRHIKVYLEAEKITHQWYRLASDDVPSVKLLLLAYGYPFAADSLLAACSG
jgi:hypothetical protein